MNDTSAAKPPPYITACPRVMPNLSHNPEIYVSMIETSDVIPAFNEFFGVLFFLSLVLAGITSLVSIIETYISGLCDKFGITRGQAVMYGGGFAALVSFIYATQGGMYFLDAADYFINQFGVAALGLVEVVLIAWVLRKLGTFKKHANEISDIR